MKKKILALCLVIVLAVTAVTGVTLAYFTDQDKANNVFTVGDLNIELKEEGKVMLGTVDQSTKTNEKGEEEEWKLVQHGYKEEQEEGEEPVFVPDGDDYGFSYVELVPGNVITKKPTIYNISDNPAYVRVAVVMDNLHEINNAIDEVYENLETPYTDDEIQAVYDDIFRGWGINYEKDKTNGHNNRMWMTKPDNGHVLAVDMAAEYKPYGEGGQPWWNIDNANTFQNDIDKATATTDGTTYTPGSYYDKAIGQGERVYVYYLSFQNEGEAYTLFEGLHVPEDFDCNRVSKSVHATDGRIDQMAMFDDLDIKIYVDAIQQEGFATWQDAFAELEKAHPLGSDYYLTTDEVN